MKRFALLLTSADPGVARNMAFMYATNSLARGWWDEVRLIVWGPSAKLLTEDASFREEIAQAVDAGVELLACISCAERYDAVEGLEKLGFDVISMGQPLTQMLQSDWTVLSV